MTDGRVILKPSASILKTLIVGKKRCHLVWARGFNGQCLVSVRPVTSSAFLIQDVLRSLSENFNIPSCRRRLSHEFAPEPPPVFVVFLVKSVSVSRCVGVGICGSLGEPSALVVVVVFTLVVRSSC